MRVDTHIHTQFSDGVHSLSDIIDIISNKMIEHNDKTKKYIGITDHDIIGITLKDIENARNKNIVLIPGIELSTYHNNESIHILGYFTKDIFNQKDFMELLLNMKNKRLKRAEKIISKLNTECNIQITLKDLLDNSDGVIGRPHIAKTIIDAGYPYTYREIFDNFLADGKKAFVPATRMSTLEGIELLKKHNAIVILAHPKLIHNSKIEDFLSMNIDGIEAIYSQNTEEENIKYLKLAKNNQLACLCGSDYHNDDVGGIDNLGNMNISECDFKIFLKLLEDKEKSL